MPRIGSALALLLLATPAVAEVEFYQTLDRDKVGTEDTFHLTIVVSDAPEGATVQFPAPADLEVLSRSQSTQMSYSIGAGGAGIIKRVQKYTVTMRATHAGTLTVPSAVLATASRSYKTETLKLEVVKGRTSPPPQTQPARPQSPFGAMGDDDPFAGIFPGMEPQVPRSDTDLFLRASLDKDEVYVGEQATLTLTIYSRFDLSSVDSVTMPKLEGFWSEDIESPTQLAPEQKTIGGVPYRAYLLRRRALFPVKSGSLTVDPAEADITIGLLFQGQRMHRRGNPLTLKVKPLPKDANTSNVGRWRLSTEVSQTKVALGDPVTVKVILEGKGNLKNAAVPPLTGPHGLKVYEPQTNDRLTATHGALGGRRTLEYIVVANQTGTFTLPGLALSFFNPESKRVEESKTDPITLTVTPGANGQTAGPVPAAGPNDDPTLKNQLVATGLKSLRHTGTFRAPRPALFTQWYFIPLAAGPIGLSLAFGLLGFARRSLSKNDPVAERKRQARAARIRLAAAEKLQSSGKTADFYTEVEKALVSFLEAKLSAPITGLRREQIDSLMTGASVAPAVRVRVLAALETSDMGRFAPGMGEAAARTRALDDAAAAMEAWDAR